MRLSALIQKLETRLPLTLQEDWDHGGVNLGSRNQEIKTVLFSYDVCLEAVRAAVKRRAELIVSHHPFRMQAAVDIDLDDYEGRLIAACVKQGIALYSCHTAHDASEDSLNFHYLKKLHLKNIRPLRPSPLASDTQPLLGLGAVGDHSVGFTRTGLIRRLKSLFRCRSLRFVDGGKKRLRRIGICTGAGMSLLSEAEKNGCDLFITGDVKYHQALQAKRNALSLVDPGHFACERDSVVILQRIFMQIFGPSLKVHVYTGLRDVFETL